MPKFNFTPATQQVQQVQDRVVSSKSAEIMGQANINLAGSIMGAAQSVNVYQQKKAKMEDEADMVQTRAAVLRLQQEESEAMRSSSNTEEIDSINSSYTKKYEAIINGKDPVFGRSYFRNQSGKAEFTNAFMTPFNTKRTTNAKEQQFQLDRRNTHSSYMNGIKSIPQSNYFNKPAAEQETRHYVKKLVEGGFLTEEEGAEQTKLHLSNLDIERANRTLVGINTDPKIGEGQGMGETVEMQADQYKEYVNGLSNLTDVQKDSYNKKADGLVKQANAVQKTYNDEVAKQVKIEQNNTDYDALLAVTEGKMTSSDFMNDNSISTSARKSYLSTYQSKIKKRADMAAKEKLSAKERQASLKMAYDDETIAGKILAFDPANDPTGEVRTNLGIELSGTGFNANQMTLYKNYLAKGADLPAEAVEQRKYHAQDLKRVFGLTKESLEIFSEQDYDVKGSVFDKDRVTTDDTGRTYLDGLETIERQKLMNGIISQYDSMIRQGKPKEAEAYIKEKVTEVEKTHDDRTFYNEFFTSKTTYK